MSDAAGHDVDGPTFRLLVRHATAAADPVAIKNLVRPITEAQRTEAIVGAAIRCLIDNRLVTVVPREEWPEYVYPDGKPEGVR